MSLKELRKEYEELKNKIAERIREAKHLNIYSTARMVAEHLGKRIDKRYGNYWIYDNGELRITYDDYGGTLSIIHKGKKVFSSRWSGEIYLYIPSGWVKKLYELYERAREAAEMKEAERLMNEIKRIKKEWGL